ncbi:TetR/AcrR family transcriptional regulator [Salinispirillum marinum]|uniref:TetR/AcrR family transcriptional regulator n=2 Tax=Saccharospirillaceae TaxID=255527 RepID=A0ABV8BJH4_9GAMM
MTQPKKSAYHHGNLKAALIDAGFKALETGSLEELSLRALAKAVGVTPTAAYNHFADKMALMVEMKTEGFQRFDAALHESLSAADPASPEGKVRAMARAYLHFAFTHPGIFNLIFFWTPEPEYFTNDLMQAAGCAERHLQNTMSEMFAQEGFELTEYQQAVASFSAWSLVHGVTLLLRTGVVDAVTHCGNWPTQFSSANREEQARILEHVFTIELEGLKHTLSKFQP